MPQQAQLCDCSGQLALAHAVPMIAKALGAALASTAPVGAERATCSARACSRTFPDSCKVQAGLWQCGHCVSTARVGTGSWLGTAFLLSHSPCCHPRAPGATAASP